MSVVFNFSWDHFNSQAKLKTMLMQNFGVTDKEHHGMLWCSFRSGQCKPLLSWFVVKFVFLPLYWYLLALAKRWPMKVSVAANNHINIWWKYEVKKKLFRLSLKQVLHRWLFFFSFFHFQVTPLTHFITVHLKRHYIVVPFEEKYKNKLV